jgi:hypothetical protein
MTDHAPHSRRGGADSYDLFADNATVTPAKQPSDAWKHALAIGGVTVLGGGAGYMLGGVVGALVGGAGSLLGSAVILGLALMVMGWLRAVNERMP